ncbi:MAG: hypothetical protein ACLFO2_02840 [Candidatus Woesearchaeota archaeon]
MRVPITLMVAVLAVTLALTGCGGSECESDDECTSVGQCEVARCVDGLCKTTPEDDCCGNNRCEEGAGENPCTCAQDCSLDATEDGTCDGKVELPHDHIEGRMVSTKHAEYFCRDDECVVGVPEPAVESKRLFSTHRGDVDFEVVSSLDQPFVVGEGSFKARVKLTDMDSRVRLPVRITGLQVLSEGELIAEESLKPAVQLSNVGDSHEEFLTLEPALGELEDERSITVRVSYEYTRVLREESETIRRTLEKRYSRLWFVAPENAP